MIDVESAGSGALTISETVADARALHADRRFEGALFQVASQFNLLEMISPSVTPENGIAIYSGDPTQGPACAIAAGAGTIFRNYFAPVNGMIGQSADNQIDCLNEIGAELGNRQESLWSMQNGYALASERGLSYIDKILAEMDAVAIDNLRAKLAIGIQWDTEVTHDNSGHLVNQIYCSALPVAYSPYPQEDWERFARLILEATYEATFTAAVLNFQKTGNRKLFLTLVGGGAFGNETDWILSAIRRACDIFEKYPLDVCIVSYKMSNPQLETII